tara:strand:- start:49743 stop:51197 length:1455 start_codon:yes stop_codon:yes gene_type:complete
MANFNAVAKNINVPTADGVKTYYNMVVVNEQTGQIDAAILTTKQSEAEAFIAEQKEKNSNFTINGQSDTDPFSDGTFEPEKNFDEEKDREDLNLDADIQNNLLNEQGVPATNDSNVSSYNNLSNFDDTVPPYNPPGKSGLSRTSLFSTSLFEKKARDLGGSSEKKKEQFEKLSEEQRGQKNISGVFGSKRVQAMVKRENTASEVIVGRGVDNNAFIVIGNDRVNKPHTGYGGKGHTQCDSIDLVAGLGGYNPKEVEKIETDNGDMVESEIKVNPYFLIDSARIYMSQKTDVDKNFAIGEFGKSNEEENQETDITAIGKYGAKSAVVVKADNVRLIGRESIRIVTGTDKFNSQGGEVLGKSGIEIVAMNKTDSLQPMVLGDNLIKLLDTIIGQIESLANITHASVKYQMKMNQAVMSHTHLSPFFALPTTVSGQAEAGGIQCGIETMTKTELSTIKQSTNLQGIRANYLTESGDNYINSTLNKVN